MLRQYITSQKELLTFALNRDSHGLSGIFRLFEGSFYPFSMEPLNPIYLVNDRYSADIEFIRSMSAGDMALAFKEETLAFNSEIKQIGEMETSRNNKFDKFAKDVIVRHLCDTGDA